MSEIKRIKCWLPTKNSAAIEYADDGQFVNYTDHQAAIKQARIDAVREFSAHYHGNYPLPLDIDIREVAEDFIKEL